MSCSLPKVIRGNYKPGQLPEDGLLYTDGRCFEHYFHPASLDPMPRNFLFLIEQRGGKPDLLVVTRLVREGQLDAPLHEAAVAMLGDRFAGGLSVEEPQEEGGLSLSQGTAGGLSEEEPRPPRRASSQKVGQ